MEQPGGPPLVLVAEDEHDIAMLIEMALTRVGFRVHAVGDGLAALDEARRNQPDAIMLDVRMPHLDGIEACRALRAREDTAQTPIIMLSAMARDVDAVRGLSAGANAYVVKPFSPQEMARQVVHVLLQYAPNVPLPPAARALIA